MNEIIKSLEDLRKRLVDTDARNRLIHVNRKSKRARAVPIIDERSDDVFKILRVGGKRMRFAAKGTEEEADPSQISLVLGTKTFDESRYTDKILDTPLAPDTLQKKLLSIYRAANTAEEERGVNFLYLAMGFLKWFEDENSEIEREAPLILIPVELIRNKRTSSYDIKARNEDIVTNLPMQKRLLRSFHIGLPEIDDSEDWHPSQYFRKVSDLIQNQSRWSIDENGMQVGFFSFAKSVMWEDLNPENWRENSLVENPVVAGLLSTGFEPVEPLFPEDANLDEFLKLEDMLHVIDADASQTKVIHEVRSGRNLVVQGPPGTGKSQTITNILAAAAHDEKRVLFIAEKMAALNVVHQRMSKMGLNDLCLELHSKSANKKSFLQELERTLARQKSVMPGINNSNRHTQTRDRLNAIVKTLHTPLAGRDFSPFHALSELIKFSNIKISPYEFRSPILETITLAKEKQILEALRELKSLHEHRKDFSRHPFKPVRNLQLQPPELKRLEPKIQHAETLLAELSDSAKQDAESLNTKIPDTFAKLDDLKKFAELAKKTPTADAAIWQICLAEKRQGTGDFVRALKKAIEWCDAKKQCKNEITADAWDADFSKIKKHIEIGTQGLLYRIPFFSAYWEASKTLATMCKKEIPENADERLKLVNKILDAQGKRRSFKKSKAFLSERIGKNWEGENTKFNLLLKSMNWIEAAPNLVRNYSSAELQEALQKLQNHSKPLKHLRIKHEAENEITKICDALKIRWSPQRNFKEIPLRELKSALAALSENFHLYNEWVTYSDKRQKIKRLGFQDLLAAIDEKHISIDEMEFEFLCALNETRWDCARAAIPALGDIQKTDRHEIVRKFQYYEKSRIEETKRFIRDRHLNHLNQLPTTSDDGMRFLRHEMNKKMRHKPIRTLMSRAANIIQEIKPVFLMSPISVAQFLPPEKLEFDLLVIDEASQVRPEDAIGAIARVKQIVVVGDKKQLPPTSFFDRLTDDDMRDEDDDDEEENPVGKPGEMESVLNLCETQGISNSMLLWHYRSRDPSLIACSNLEFYDNRLMLPPSPYTNASTRGMTFHKVAGVYTSASFGQGRRGTNQIEAEAIVARLSELAREHPDYSVGIATCSKPQADMIDAVLDRERRSDSALGRALNSNKHEQVFVKNIENVQGDERDVILISIGYGPYEPNGRLASMRFGPINQDGGERRLNVLFTRARVSCEIFCSFEPSDIDLNRTKMHGPEVLKNYLNFAQTKVLPQQQKESGEPDNGFEEDIAKFIRSQGYEVSHQVPSAGFKIDLGVKSKSNPDHYILAVECDGASYHSALWARERDKLRQEILEKMGWRFHRIWSTDWFQERHKETEKLKEVLASSKDLNLGEQFKGANQNHPASSISEESEPKSV